MKVDIFTLCDSAQEYGGKLIIVGTFNSIYAKEFPTLHPEFALVARVVFSENEKGVHKIDFSVKKNDENVYIMPPGQMTADTTNTKGKDAIINVVVKGNNIPIPSDGTYVVTLKVDDKVWESDLHVVKVEDMK
ncbi:hypothetical protein M3090_01325 [Bacteroides sp. ET71]|uniref:DUF6941 family protein n=1 Tax=Bacteroides sp. ET71 TaxID=2939421 RepID=UPI002011F4F8|nr:hypothetical protein [Bacteroides sp. ET71]MCL1615052.1 hypothetical protein [Bacteroides sp. ET71]